MVWYSHLFKNFSQFAVIHTVKGLDVINKAEIDDFLELSCFLDDPADVDNLISGSSAGFSAFFKTSLNIWKLLEHLKQLEHLDSVTISTFSPSNSREVMGPEAMILGFSFLLIFSFKPFSHSLPSRASRCSLVLLCFLPLEWYHLYI